MGSSPLSSTLERRRRDSRTATRGRLARGGAGHSARAVLRPRLRARADAVHGADGVGAELGGPRAVAPDTRRPLVVLGRLCVAHERDRPRGGGRQDRGLRRDGRVPRRRAVRARRVRRFGVPVRLRVRRDALRADRAVRDRQPRRPGVAQLGRGPGGEHRRRGRAAPGRCGHRRRGSGRALGGGASSRLRRSGSPTPATGCGTSSRARRAATSFRRCARGRRPRAARAGSTTARRA